MASLKHNATRTLRSKFPTQNPRALSGVNRSINITSKNSTSLHSASKQESSGYFIPSNLPPAIPLLSSQQSQSQRTSSLQSTISPNHNAFTHLLSSLTQTLTTTPSPSLPQLHTLLRAYTSNPSHWSPFAHANPQKQYTRNLVCEVPGLFNLLILVWTPGKRSPVHDHADSHCLMKVLKGELQEKRFAIPRNPGNEGPLVQTSQLNFGADKVTYISDQLGLHEIHNPSPTEYAVSLHLYTPPNAAIRGCHIYDAESGEAKHVMQGAYDSVAGVVTDMKR